MAEPEVFIDQPDGRRVAGPNISIDLGRPNTGAPPRKWFALLVGLTFALVSGVFIGQTAGDPPAPTWQDLYQERILEGCLPQAVVGGVGVEADSNRLADSLIQAKVAIHATYRDAKNVETHLLSVATTDRLRKVNPQAELVAVVTLERCLE